MQLCPFESRKSQLLALEDILMPVNEKLID